MSAKAALQLIAALALVGAAGCDAADAVKSPRRQSAATIVRPTIAGSAGAPVVRVGDRVVLTAAQAEEAVRLALRAGVDLPTRQVYLIEAPSGGSACPMRYVVLTIAGTRSVATPPFGSCSSRARLMVERGKVVVRMPGFSNVGPAGPEQQFYLEADRMAATVPDPDASIVRNLVYAPSFKCTAGASPTAADAMLAAFEADYPKALVDPAQVELQQLAPATLQRIVADLGCLAGQVGGDAFIPEQAVALFASRRHGAAAFVALDALARTGDAGAQRFRVQMRAYISAS